LPHRLEEFRGRPNKDTPLFCPGEVSFIVRNDYSAALQGKIQHQFIVGVGQARAPRKDRRHEVRRTEYVVEELVDVVLRKGARHVGAFENFFVLKRQRDGYMRPKCAGADEAEYPPGSASPRPQRRYQNVCIEDDFRNSVHESFPILLCALINYILTGLSQKTEVKWYDVVSGSIVGGKDRMEASAKMVRVKDRTFVWAGESGDRSLIFGALKRGGQRKLAERIVSKMKQDLF